MYLSVFFVFFNLKTTCFLIEKKTIGQNSKYEKVYSNDVFVLTTLNELLFVKYK